MALVHGVKEDWCEGVEGGSDGAGVWSQGNTFYRVGNLPLPVDKSPQSLGCCSPGRENLSTFHSTHRAPFYDCFKHANE